MLARSLRARTIFGCCLLLQAAGVFWTAFMLSQSVPFWPINPLLSTNAWQVFQLDLARTMWAILPATLLWGASFPLALAAAASEGEDPARLEGGIYAANTGGAILGALAFSLFLVPWIGTQGSERALMLVAAASGLV